MSYLTALTGPDRRSAAERKLVPSCAARISKMADLNRDLERANEQLQNWTSSIGFHLSSRRSCAVLTALNFSMQPSKSTAGNLMPSSVSIEAGERGLSVARR
jgi:light-regulated signal transduction histidine kinase (bacteriophytochrome)